ncbi:MAG: hypothetical protein LBG74_08635 [Spirochaetaceae bacterium]|jgi:flavodoxin|nr:hypothetical protein [Spirochaetaceae bacterium]
MNKKTITGLAVALCLLMPAIAHAQATPGKSKVAVIYYSLSENTDMVAKKIAALLNADIIRLETAQAYNTRDMVKFRDFAKTEQNSKKWPELKPLKTSLSGYQTIFLGSPVWYSSIANPMVTFLSQNDLSGKRVITFGTCSGGEGDFFKEFDKNIKNAFVEKGLMFQNASNDKGLDKKISDWVKKVKL